MRERRSTYRDLVEKPERRMPLGGSRPRWEGNSKMDLQEVGWGNILIWSVSGYRHVASACKFGNETSGSSKCREFIDFLKTS